MWIPWSSTGYDTNAKKKYTFKHKGRKEKEKPNNVSLGPAYVNAPQDAVQEQSLTQLAARITQHGGSRGPIPVIIVHVCFRPVTLIRWQTQT